MQITENDWERIVAVKEQLVDEGYEAEEAEQEAAEMLGFDYDAVLDFLDAAY